VFYIANCVHCCGAVQLATCNLQLATSYAQRAFRDSAPCLSASCTKLQGHAALFVHTTFFGDKYRAGGIKGTARQTKTRTPLLGSKQVSSWRVGSTYFGGTSQATHVSSYTIIMNMAIRVNETEDRGFILNQWMDTSCQSAYQWCAVPNKFFPIKVGPCIMAGEGVPTDLRLVSANDEDLSIRSTKCLAPRYLYFYLSIRFYDRCRRLPETKHHSSVSSMILF
jgi:hypothetical protein